MLAMDVVDTLRRRQRLVEREYDSDRSRAGSEAASSQNLCRSGYRGAGSCAGRRCRGTQGRALCLQVPAEEFLHTTGASTMSLAAAGVNGFSAASPRCCSPGSPTTSWLHVPRGQLPERLESAYQSVVGGVDKRRARATGATTVQGRNNSTAKW